MKQAFIILLSLICFSCSNGIEKNGSIELNDGNETKIDVPYTINSDLSSFKYRLEHENMEFLKIAELASSQAKSSCKNKLTYRPKSIESYIEDDLITIRIEYTASNAFNVPMQGHAFVKFKSGKIIEFLPIED